MTKFRKSLLIFGILALAIGVALGTFIVLSLTGSLKSEPIALEFTVDDAQKEYDGEALTATGYSITDGRLIEGHTPAIKFIGAQTEVGVSQSGLEIKIVDDKGYDVTSEYKIKVNSGLLTVGPCSLQVNLTAQDVIYDGNTVEIGNGYTVTGGKLAKGHRVSAQIKDEWVENTGKSVAGSTLNAQDIDILILDSNGRDVTDNYALMLAGRVNIIKRPLVLTPVSAEKTYDGKPLECSQYNIESGSLAAGHYISARFEAKDGTAARATDANSDYPLEIVIKAVVYDINGDDVTENYDLKSNIGYLTVNKATLTLTAKSGRWEYDGQEHSLSSDYTVDSAIGLIYGDFVTVTYSGSVTDVSVEDNIIESYSIIDSDTNISKEDNYEVTLKSGSLEVTKAPFTVKLKSLEKEYGDSFADEEPYVLVSGIENAELKFNDDNYLTELFECVTEIGNSTYTISDFKVYNGSADITDNLNVTVVAGNLKVNRRKVTLNSNLEKEYDGNFIFTEGISFDKDLAEGHRLVSVTCVPVSSAGTNNTVITSVSVVDAQGNNATGYYDISYPSSVSVTVTAKALKASTGSDSKAYDGTPLYGGGLSHDPLAAGDRLIVTQQFEITNCSENEEKNNVPQYEIRNSQDEDVTSFYSVDVDYGTLTIDKKEVTVYFPEDSTIEYKEGWIKGTDLYGLIRCDEMSAENFGIVNESYVGFGVQHAATFEWRIDDEEILGNYEIKQGNNKFEIVRKNRTETLVNAGHGYNNDPIDEAFLETKLIELKIIPADETERVKYSFVSSNLLNMVDAEEYDAEIVYNVSSYERLTITGKYTITPIKVKVIENKDQIKTYDGLPFIPELQDLKVTNNAGAEYDFLSVKSFVRERDAVNVTDNSISFKLLELVITGTGESVKSGNVIIDYANSVISVTINKRPLTITIDTVSGNANGLTMLNGQDLTGLIRVSNLVDCDNTIKFLDADRNEISNKSGIVWVTPNYRSELREDVKITFWRDGKNVSDNYDIPTEIIGVVITTN